MIARLLCRIRGHRWHTEVSDRFGVVATWSTCRRCGASGATLRDWARADSFRHLLTTGHPEAIAECRKRAA